MAALPLDPIPEVWTLFDVALPDHTDGLEGYLEQVLDRCATWFDAVGASVFLSAPSESGDGVYRLAACTGRSRGIPKDATVRHGEGIAGIVLAECEPRRLDDPARDRQFSGREVPRGEGIGSSLIIPLCSSGGPLGVLNLARSDTAQAFADTDLDAARTLGRYVALAVHNARLLAEAGRFAEEQRQAHERLQAVLSLVTTAVVVVETEGRVRVANPAAATLLGRSAQPEETWEAWLLGATPALQAALSVAPHRSPGPERVQEAEGGSGAAHLWVVDAQRLQGGGTVIAVQDLSDVVQWQAERDRLARLAEIGQMTAAIAHEIRNPLTGIAAAAQMIEMDADTAAEFGSVIREEALRLNTLCDEFLAFARPIRLHRTLTRLGDLAARVIRRDHSRFQAVQQDVRLEIEPGEPMISLDPDRMDQVITNLLQNAREASSPGSTVSVTIAPGSLTVRDTGQGMSEDQLTRLFTPFFTTKPQGTGLGLSTVRKLVEAHGARLDVTSDVGVGSTFTLRFPREAVA